MHVHSPRLQRTAVLMAFSGLLVFGWQLPAVAQTAQDQTVNTATKVLNEIMAVPAQQIPQSLLSSAAGVAIFPNVVKGGFVVGVRHGKGVILVRDDNQQWQPPVFASMTGGSVGWQAGLQSTDVVLVFKTRRSVEGLMKGKLTIGADAAAAAGPVGRQAAAATDARLAAEILSYSRSRGLFAGVSIDGSVIQLDQNAGTFYYGRPTVDANGQSLVPLATLPASALRLMNQLAQYTGSPQVGVPSPAGAPPLGTAPPAGEPTVPVAANGVPQTELVRRHLVASWQRLSLLLDDQWRAYLEPPREVLVPGPPPTVQRVQEKVQHYTAISQDARYALLNQAPEFSATLALLQQYAKSLAAATNPKITLPPPPLPNAGAGNTGPR